MEIGPLCDELLSIAEKMRHDVRNSLPDDDLNCFAILVDVLRVMDQLQLNAVTAPEEKRLPGPTLEIIAMGSNLAFCYLFKSMKVKGFPMRELTLDGKSEIVNLLYKLGGSLLINRVVDMGRTGIVSVSKESDTFKFSATESAKKQFLDHLLVAHHTKLQDKVEATTDSRFGEWNLVPPNAFDEIIRKPGSFLSVEKEDALVSSYILPNIDDIMLPHLSVWDSGHGLMMAYDTTPQIDHHFYARTFKIITRWQEDVGLHPDVELNGVSAADLTWVISFIVSFHLKHIHFALLAIKQFPEINVAQSLTRWTPLEDLKAGIIVYTKLTNQKVSAIFESIMMKQSDAKYLESRTEYFMPLIIDMGNDMVLMPVSSVLRNPLYSIISLIEARNPNIRDKINSEREKWQRKNLYSSFKGNRYQTIEGSINLRSGEKIITDIDAVVYDTVAGELAIFQLKWQDFNSNDVRKLRSKARNLTRDLDEWAKRVTTWIEQFGYQELKKCLRIKNTFETTTVYLFGLCQNAAHMGGYGYNVESSNLAICNWAQFQKNRTDIGPADRVFRKLFHALKEEAKITPPLRFLGTEFTVYGKTLEFENLWTILDE
jgi:hypothetical protein